MKIFELCICALACISLTSSLSIFQSTNESVQFVNACAIEAGIAYEDDYDIRDILNDTIDKPELEEKTQKHGCVVECILRKLNWMQKSELKEEQLYADINKTSLKNHPLKIQIEEFIRDCVTKVKLTPQERCNRGIVVMKCVVKGMYRLFPSLLNEHDESEENENN